MAIADAFTITVLEGPEVVFLAAGAGGVLLVPVSRGGAPEGVAPGLLLHRPLSMVPGNTLPFPVGVPLAAFGTLRVGEGPRLVRPGGDWSIFGLTLADLFVAALAGPPCRHRASVDRSQTAREVPPRNALRTILRESVGLFVDDAGIRAGRPTPARSRHIRRHGPGRVRHRGNRLPRRVAATVL